MVHAQCGSPYGALVQASVGHPLPLFSHLVPTLVLVLSGNGLPGLVYRSDGCSARCDSLTALRALKAERRQSKFFFPPQLIAIRFVVNTSDTHHRSGSCLFFIVVHICMVLDMLDWSDAYYRLRESHTSACTFLPPNLKASCPRTGTWPSVPVLRYKIGVGS